MRLRAATALAVVAAVVLCGSAFAMDPSETGAGQDPDPADAQVGSVGGDQPMAALRAQYDKLEEKMMVLGSEAIEKAIAEASARHRVPVPDLTRLVFAASSWGDIGSFEAIFDELGSKNLAVLSDGGRGNLADVLCYLAVKAYPDQQPDWCVIREDEEDPRPLDLAAVQAWKEEHSGTAAVLFILDDIAMRRMKVDGQMAATAKALVAAGEVELAAPVGFTGGLNLFNLLDYVEGVDVLAARAAEAQAGGEALSAEAIDTIVKAPVAAFAVEFFGGDHPVRWLQGPRPSPAAPPTAEGIAARLRPRIPSWDEYAASVDTVKECHAVADIARVLDIEGRFYSMTNLAALSRRIHAKVVEDGFEPEVYCVPEKGKSFAVANMLYLMANRDSRPELVELCPMDGPMGIKQAAGKRVLILDDYAGSGNSLIDAVDDLKIDHRLARVSPLLESDMATGRLASAGLSSFHGEVVKSLTAAPQAAWMGSSGFHNGWFFVTLPYMAPDNNCAFMLSLGPLFTYHGKGVKDGSEWPPMCSGASRVHYAMNLGRDPGLTERMDAAVAAAAGSTPAECFAFVVQYYCKASVGDQGMYPSGDGGFAGFPEDGYPIFSKNELVTAAADGGSGGPTGMCVAEAYAGMRAGTVIRTSADGEWFSLGLSGAEENAAVYRICSDVGPENGGKRGAMKYMLDMCHERGMFGLQLKKRPTTLHEFPQTPAQLRGSTRGAGAEVEAGASEEVGPRDDGTVGAPVELGPPPASGESEVQRTIETFDARPLMAYAVADEKPERRIETHDARGFAGAMQVVDDDEGGDVDAAAGAA